jgi:hypothetical protein
MSELDPTKATSSVTGPRKRRLDAPRGPIDLLDLDREGIAGLHEGTDPDPANPFGGDLACWASLVCLGCGGVTTDPAHDLQHRRWLAALERE